ncbi:DUF2793 domain-containing protein [Sphingomonas ginsenosidivorax]|uniref:DUF2793 domain-containing protein n=1 Tax=Sphingomonas ginsenosidivorax TaxID=862135 RepID=A0A5C6UI67_9SPHN|nr:DUF2793 domain-containing protein [Sphingomonas ginsenosidivorax]TXC72150.1 DUF2793 domain-containing protein [Sphingomonas ginsenosidivorax]
MSETSARLGLPLLQPGQAQKELTHNEALTLLDLAVQAGVVAVGVNVPPASPVVGQAWVVGNAPTGVWSGHAQALAGWTEGGWRFVAAREGMAVWSIAGARETRFVDGAWRVGMLTGSGVTIDGIRVVGPQHAAIAGPISGSVVDAEARAVIGAMLAALRAHGLIAS